MTHREYGLTVRWWLLIHQKKEVGTAFKFATGKQWADKVKAFVLENARNGRKPDSQVEFDAMIGKANFLHRKGNNRKDVTDTLLTALFMVAQILGVATKNMIADDLDILTLATKQLCVKKISSPSAAIGPKEARIYAAYVLGNPDKHGDVLDQIILSSVYEQHGKDLGFATKEEATKAILNVAESIGVRLNDTIQRRQRGDQP